MKLLELFTKNYPKENLFEERKANYTVGFVLILTVSTSVLTILKMIIIGFDPLETIISIINIIAFLIILYIVYKRHLLVAVWVLSVLGVIRILSVLLMYELVHYYVLVPLILIANGFIHYRKSQFQFLNISILLISVYNLVLNWYDYFTGNVEYEVAIISLVSIFYILAIIYMISRFASNTDEEIMMRGQLRSLANKDQLTDSFNRRKLDNIFDSHQLNESNGVLIFDLDHFKRVNDQFGHVVGDDVLKETVDVVNSVIRSEDLIVRYGGEEFVVILRNCPSNELAAISEKIRVTIDEHKYESLTDYSITISIGATIMKDNEGIYQTIERADKALYRAKENGRNTIVVL